ncbi:MAG: hypothetical protein ACK4GN_14840 [Runella sp.]
MEDSSKKWVDQVSKQYKQQDYETSWKDRIRRKCTDRIFMIRAKDTTGRQTYYFLKVHPYKK